MSRGPTAERLRVVRSIRGELRRLVRRGRMPHAVVQRARIVLLSAAGRGTEEIARVVGWTSRAVRKWKARFAACPRTETLEDAERSGRPALVPLAVRCQLVRLACERPDDKRAAFRDIWTYKALGDALQARTGYPRRSTRRG